LNYATIQYVRAVEIACGRANVSQDERGGGEVIEIRKELVAAVFG
jgi:hypothetical protein